MTAFQEDQMRTVLINALAALKHCVWLLADLQADPGLVQKQAHAAIANAEAVLLSGGEGGAAA